MSDAPPPTDVDGADAGDQGGRVEPIEIQEEMERSFLDYSMSVITARALPDARDGLKPVHRRILWGMYDMRALPDRPTLKCARVTGDVMGKYHPHGDSRHLRRPGAHGPALQPAPPAGPPPGQLRLARRSAGRRPLHRVPPHPHRHADAGRHRRGHRRLRRQLLGRGRRAPRPAGALPQPAGQRQPGHRGGHGHQHPAPQPGRGDRRHRPPARPTPRPPPTTSCSSSRAPTSRPAG